MKLRVAVDESWAERAACRGHWTDTFAWTFYEMVTGREPSQFHQQAVLRAKKVCARCPVRAECLAWAIAEDERWGVLGGLTPPERWRERVRVPFSLAWLDAQAKASRRPLTRAEAAAYRIFPRKSENRQKGCGT